MNKVNLWESNISSKVNYYDIDELIEVIKSKKITDFRVLNETGLGEDEMSSSFVDIFNSKAEEQNLEIIYFDEKHLAFEEKFFDNIHIEKKFYEMNKNKIICAVIENLYEKNYVHINKYIYSESLVKNLMLTVEQITFGEGIELSDEIINLLKSNRINASIKRNGKLETISSSDVLGNDYDRVISKDKLLTIRTDISDLENLSLIPSHKTIKITNGKLEDMNEEELENTYNIISKLRENGQKNIVVVSIENRRNFRKSKIYNSDFKNIKIHGIDFLTYKLEELKEEENLLDLMVQDIKVSNFSPLEKYIAVYNIVKKFKEYKENPKDLMSSRKINKILNNDYMVCVGYSKLLEELLYRVGIDTYHYRVSTDTSYDKGFSIEEKSVELIGHARLIVNINDPMYGINGFYVADPTWDNDLEKDYYNHALMSFDKTAMSKRFFELSKEDLLINVNNMEQFVKNVNFLINREKNEEIDNGIYKEEKQAEFTAYKSIIEIIKNLLVFLDAEAYEKLKNKYPFIETLSKIRYNLNYFENFNNFLTDVGNFFVERNGKDIPLETIIDAACEVNKNVFSFNNEQLEIYKKELLEQNLKEDKKSFPYYYEDQISKKVA